MSHLRKDPLIDRWVIIAEERANKPDDYRLAEGASTNRRCPFCPGNESDTPAEIAVYHQSDDPGWQVRVVPNQYPALQLPCQSPLPAEASPSLRAGEGVHEVIIESPSHVASFSEVSDIQAEFTFTAYRDRLRALAKLDPLAHALVFKNSGAGGGASIIHTHSQLLAMPLVPPLMQQELCQAESYYRQQDRCLFCALIENEISEAIRVVAQTTHFIALCPFAGRFAYETWLLPRHHEAQFEQIPLSQIPELAVFFRDIVRRIEMVAGQSDYNFLIHSAPFDTSAQDHYHWHIEIFPRITGLAGYELGTGCFVNPVSPEAAADKLRNITVPW